ncbi:MAG: GntR family transcriptional regulator [Phycisphaerae bacterium]|nr:GntR family transcriptional regulator [Phycisphaerae bacterium]
MSLSRLVNNNMTAKNAGPKWHVLKRYFESELESGKYQPGDALPSENQLARAVGIARNTVRQALAELEKEGVIYKVRGSGTFFTETSQIASNNRNTQQNQVGLDIFGLVIPEIRRSLYPSLAKGFDRRSSQDYHQTMICNTDYSIAKQGDIILQAVDKKMAGIAMVPSPNPVTPAHHIRQLHNNNIPVVFCHRRVPGISAPFVGWDWQQVGYLAGRAFAEKGHKNIMYLGVYRYEITEAHVAGMRQALAECGLSLPDHKIVFGPSRDVEDREDIIDRTITGMLGSSDRPTAIFCSDDNEAERVFWLAYREGVFVPEELNIMGFGNSARSTTFRKQLASIVVDEYALGEKAADLLLDICNGKIAIDSDYTHLMDLDIIENYTLAQAGEK